MDLTVNGEPIAIEESATLFHLVQKLSMSARRGIAVAINDQVVAQSDWNSLVLKPNDSVLIISASQGG